MGYPRRVLERLMTYAELRQWVRDYSDEPFDDRRCFDMPAARVENLLSNINRDTKRHPQPLPLADFVPYPRRRAPEDLDLDREILKNL